MLSNFFELQNIVLDFDITRLDLIRLE